MLIVTREQIKEAVNMTEAIAVMKKALSDFSLGRTVIPLRTPLSINKSNGVMLFMPGYMPEQEILGIKTISLFEDNPRRGLPTTQAVFQLVDSSTGEMLALLEAGYSTALRTGACSGVATELFSLPQAKKVAVFGAGVQARTQLEAVCCVRDIAEVAIYDLMSEKVDSFITDMSKILHGIEYKRAASSKDAVSDADIVICATTARAPVFNGADLKEGAHINAIGSYTPEMKEVDVATLRRASKIVSESIEAAFEEAGDFIDPHNEGWFDLSYFHADLGDVILGNAKARENDHEITLYKGVGLAVEDLAIAKLAYKAAISKGLGQKIDMLK